MTTAVKTKAETALEKAAAALAVARSALEAWDEEHGAELAQFKAAAVDAERACESARGVCCKAEGAALLRLKIHVRNGFHSDFIAAIEAAVGWRWEERQALVAGNNPRHDPMVSLATSVKAWLLKADAEVQAAGALLRQAGEESTRAYRAQRQLECGRNDLVQVVRAVEREHADEKSKQDNRREVSQRRKEGPPPDEVAYRAREQAIKEARKRVAEIVEHPETFPWPPRVL